MAYIYKSHETSKRDIKKATFSKKLYSSLSLVLKTPEV
jgi:hypothetical protein